MRLAIVITSSYEQSQQLPTLSNSAEDGERIAAFLDELGLDCEIDELAATRDLSEELGRAYAESGERLEQLLIYYSGYVVSAAGRDPAMLLDGERARAYGFPRLARFAEQHAEQTLVVVDCVAVARDGLDPNETAAQVVGALAAGPNQVSAIACSRPVGSGPGPSFTELLCFAWDNLASGDDDQLPTLSQLMEYIEVEPSFAKLGDARISTGGKDIPLFGYGEATATPLVTLPPPPVVPPPPGLPRKKSLSPESPARAVPSVLPPPPVLPKQGVEVPTPAEYLEKGKNELRAGERQAALSSFEKALSGSRPTAGIAYRHIGETLASLGENRGAIEALESAVERGQNEPLVLELLGELLKRGSHYEKWEQLQRGRLRSVLDPEGRAAIYNDLSRTLLAAKGKAAEARMIVNEWSVEQPDNPDPCLFLVSLEHEQGRHREAIAARCRIAELSEPGPERGAALTEASRAAWHHLQDAELASSLAEQALATDPGARGALEVVEVLLGHEGKWQELANIYDKVCQGVSNGDARKYASGKRAALYAEQLSGAEPALEAFESAVAVDPARTDLRTRLVEGYRERAEFDAALAHCRKGLKNGAPNPALFRQLYELLDKVGARDSAWNAAVVLECLGEADINEQLVADAHRPEGLLAPQGSVLDDDWGKCLLSDERDQHTGELLGAVGEAAAQIKANSLKRRRKAPKLDPGARHDPATSTTTLAKSLLWTSKLLGVKPPQLYVADEVPGSLWAAPVSEPSALASKALGRGLSLSQLAFLWGRQLASFRPEHYVTVFYPSISELSGLMLAALWAGDCPGLLRDSIESRTKKLAKELKKTMHPGSFGRLRQAAQDYPVRELEKRAGAYLRSAVLTGGRAGLLACGDVSIASKLAKMHPVRGITTEDDQVSDLYAFSVSDEYSRIRDRLGVAVQA